MGRPSCVALNSQLSTPARGRMKSDVARQRALHTVSSDDIDVVKVVYRSMASVI